MENEESGKGPGGGNSLPGGGNSTCKGPGAGKGWLVVSFVSLTSAWNWSCLKQENALVEGADRAHVAQPAGLREGAGAAHTRTRHRLPAEVGFVKIRLAISPRAQEQSRWASEDEGLQTFPSGWVVRAPRVGRGGSRGGSCCGKHPGGTGEGV